MQQRKTDALAKGRSEGSDALSSDSSSVDRGGGGGSNRGGEAKTTVCPTLNLPLVTAARGSTCIQCRTAKVREIDHPAFCSQSAGVGQI